MSDNLTHKQTRAVAALLENPTLEQAAASAGVNSRTIRRWMGDRAFRSALSDAEGAEIDRTTRRLIALSDKALEALEDVLDNPNQKGAGNKRLAAQAVLDQLQRLRELRNVENRLSELERQVYGRTVN